MQEVEERKSSVIIGVKVSYNGGTLGLQCIHAMISEEVVEISTCEIAVLESIYSLETGVGLKIRQTGKGLSSLFDLVLLLSDEEKDPSETRLCFQADHELLISR